MVFDRISARRGNTVRLNMSFYRNGVLTDPYAIRKVEIYKNKINAANKVAEFLVGSPCEETAAYPSPVDYLTETVPAGNCGTEEVEGSPIAGRYYLDWDIPDDAESPCVYFDVWTYLPVNPCTLDDFEGSTYCDGDCPDLTSSAFDDLLLSCCNRFWVYPDGWYCDDELQTIRFGFEPLDQKFNLPELRPLEIGITPLPLYDYNFNLVQQLLPMITATIRIQTQHKEVIVQDEQMTMGLRQGSYRNSPFVLKYTLDTTNFLIGTYEYRITIHLPNGTTRTSNDFILTVG